jgi:hypothetical protein
VTDGITQPPAPGEPGCTGVRPAPAGNAARWAELNARPLLRHGYVHELMGDCADCAVSTEGIRPCGRHRLAAVREELRSRGCTALVALLTEDERRQLLEDEWREGV